MLNRELTEQHLELCYAVTLRLPEKARVYAGSRAGVTR